MQIPEFIKRLLRFEIFDRLAILFARKVQPEKRVLIIRTDAIGDFILWLDAARALVTYYQVQGYSVTLLAGHLWANWCHEIGLADEVWGMDPKCFLCDLSYRWRWLQRVRTGGFMVAIQPTYSREFLIGDSLIRATGALHRIGSHGDFCSIKPIHKRISNKWYTELIYASDEHLMELERNAEFVRGMGIKKYVARIAKLPSVAQLTKQLCIDEPHFILFPGASWSPKQWPMENFAYVLKTLHEQTGWLGVLCGSKAERELCESILTVSGIHALNLAGETSLAQLAEVIRGARLFIGNDTAAIHIAAAVNTPSVCILGGGHYGRFMPYCVEGGGSMPVSVINKMECFGCNWKCTKTYEVGSPVPCISSISVGQVLEAGNKFVELWP